MMPPFGGWARAVVEHVPLRAAESLRRAAQIVQAGGIIAFPMGEGLVVAGDVQQGSVLAVLTGLPGQVRDAPIQVLLASATGLPQVAQPISDTVWQLVQAFWPGPLRLLLPRNPALPALTLSSSRAVSVQIPGQRSVLRLLETVGLALASAAVTEGAVEAIPSLRLVLGGSLGQLPTPATVLDLTTATPTVLTNGSISAVALAQTLGQHPLLKG